MLDNNIYMVTCVDEKEPIFCMFNNDGVLYNIDTDIEVKENTVWKYATVGVFNGTNNLYTIITRDMQYHVAMWREKEHAFKPLKNEGTIKFSDIHIIFKHQTQLINIFQRN